MTVERIMCTFKEIKLVSYDFTINDFGDFWRASKSEHAKLILTEKVLHHLRRRATCIMATQSRF